MLFLSQMEKTGIILSMPFKAVIGKIIVHPSSVNLDESFLKKGELMIKKWAQEEENLLKKIEE